MIIEAIKKGIKEVLTKMGQETISFDVLETELTFGDYSSNVALVFAKHTGKNPKEVAEELKEKLFGKISKVEKIETAGVGFINFFISEEAILENLEKSLAEDYGKNDLYAGKKVMVEYAQPNPFKPFHVGHVMAITIGETLARLFENARATVKRVNYQGDVGRHVASAIYGILHKKDEVPKEGVKNAEVVEFLGDCYVYGTHAYEESNEVKEEITALNKKIFERSDEEINKIYDWGRKISFEYFDEVYERLGSHFDRYYLESEVAEDGLQIVKENIGKVFEESDGAVVWPGEKYGLHTRVFINKEGLPTYEAKEIGLFNKKLQEINPDISITETGNEQREYFKVVYKVLSLIYPNLKTAPIHISHGMMRLPSGKMSSRLGNVITAESLMGGVKNLVVSKMDNKEFAPEEKEETVSSVAVGAIKYSILKQSVGKDVHFDFEKSISFEGDSGPYLQYTGVRIKSLLKKAEAENILGSKENPEEIGDIERFLIRFPDVAKRALVEMSPQYIATYLIDLSAFYNSYYASHQIIGDKNAPYRMYLSRAVLSTLEKGLWLLGIGVPKRM
ncbi:MAG: arginine--tRNA ligase [Patescibacteria group bacterium]